MTNTPTTLRELAQCYAALPHDKKNALFLAIQNAVDDDIDDVKYYDDPFEELDLGRLTDNVIYAIEHCADGLVEGSA